MNTTFWRNMIMDTMYSPNSGNEFYVGLSSTAPTEGGTNVSEPNGNGYARVRISSFTAADDGSVHNSGEIVFPRSTGTWFPANNLATHWVLFDGSGANAHLLSSGTLEEPIGIWKNTVITIATGKVVVTLVDGVAL